MPFLTASSRVWITIFLAILVVWGGYLRFADLGAQSYWMDEGFTINAVLSIEEHGSTVLDSGRDYYCALYCYPTAWSAEVFDNAAFSYRLLAAFAGIVFIPILFFICSRLFNTGVALGASFFVTFSYFQIAWSRQARWYTLFEVFFWLALWTFYETVRAKDRRHLLIYGVCTLVFTLLAALTHQLGWLLPLIFATWFAIDRYVIKEKRSTREFVYLGIAFIVAVAVFTIRFFLLSEEVPEFLSRIELHNYLPYYTRFFLDAYWLLIALTLPGITLAATTNRKPFYYFLLATFAYVTSLAFLTDIIHYRYLFHITPVLSIGAAIGLVSMTEFLKIRWQKALLMLVVAIAFVWSGTGIITPQEFYVLESDNPATHPNRPYYAATPQPDWNAAYSYIQENKKDGDVVVSSMPVFNKIFLGEPGYWLSYNYLGFKEASSDVVNGKETYVGAIAIDSSSQFSIFAEEHTGYVVIDSMGLDRIAPDMRTRIEAIGTPVFEADNGVYSHVTVFRF